MRPRGKGRFTQTISLMVTPEMRQQIEKRLIRKANQEGHISTLGEFVRDAIEKELKTDEQR